MAGLTYDQQGKPMPARTRHQRLTLRRLAFHFKPARIKTMTAHRITIRASSLTAVATILQLVDGDKTLAIEGVSEVNDNGHRKSPTHYVKQFNSTTHSDFVLEVLTPSGRHMSGNEVAEVFTANKRNPKSASPALSKLLDQRKIKRDEQGKYYR
jgi:hypothetical protein